MRLSSAAIVNRFFVNSITKSLGHDINDKIAVFIGVGYKKEGATTYYNPLIHDYMHIPDKNYDTKPAKSTYIKYHLGQ